MDLGYKQEVTVGGLVILAILLFIVGTTWLSGRSIGGDPEDYWKVQFRQAGNLKVRHHRSRQALKSKLEDATSMKELTGD